MGRTRSRSFETAKGIPALAYYFLRSVAGTALKAVPPPTEQREFSIPAFPETEDDFQRVPLGFPIGQQTKPPLLSGDAGEQKPKVVAIDASPPENASESPRARNSY
jgi:hypothetical protein